MLSILAVIVMACIYLLPREKVRVYSLIGKDKSNVYSVFSRGDGIFIVQSSDKDFYFIVVEQYPHVLNTPDNISARSLSWSEDIWGGFAIQERDVRATELSGRTITSQICYGNALKSVSFDVPGTMLLRPRG